MFVINRLQNGGKKASSWDQTKHLAKSVVRLGIICAGIKVVAVVVNRK